MGSCRVYVIINWKKKNKTGRNKYLEGMAQTGDPTLEKWLDLSSRSIILHLHRNFTHIYFLHIGSTTTEKHNKDYITKKKKKKLSTTSKLKKCIYTISLNFLSPSTITVYLPIRLCKSTYCLSEVSPPQIPHAEEMHENFKNP